MIYDVAIIAISKVFYALSFSKKSKAMAGDALKTMNSILSKK